MRENIITLISCVAILGISISTCFNMIVGFFNPTETNSVYEGHLAEQEVNGTAKDDSGINGFLNSFSDNLAGKEEGAKVASEVSKSTSGNTYIESDVVLLGKDNWLFLKANDDGDPISDYQCLYHYSDEEMAEYASKLEQEAAVINSYGCDFYILSIPNKASVYPEYMPDTVTRESDYSKTDGFMDYLKNNTSLNVIDTKASLVKAKESNQVYYKTDTHYNQIGAFITVQDVLKAVTGSYEKVKNVSFNIETENMSGDLASLCNMEDTFCDDVKYVLDSSTVSSKKKSDKKILIVGDSFAENAIDIYNQYFQEATYINIWSFTLEDINTYQPDIVIWEGAERYTDRFAWVSLTSE